MNTMRRLTLTTIGPVLGLLALSLAVFFNQRALDHAQANRYESSAWRTNCGRVQTI